MGGGHFDGRPFGESRGFDHFRDEPHLDHGLELSPYLYEPYDDYGEYGPGYRYGGYCDPYSPSYNLAYCDY
jgi:hypothetical protein